MSSGERRHRLTDAAGVIGGFGWGQINAVRWRSCPAQADLSQLQAAVFAADNDLRLLFARGNGVYGAHLDYFEPAAYPDCRISPEHYDVGACHADRTCLTTAENDFGTLLEAAAPGRPVRIHHGYWGSDSMGSVAGPARGC